MSRPTCAILSALGDALKFEIAIGLNGRVWVHSDSPLTTTVVVNAILHSELLGEDQSASYGKKIAESIARG